MKVKIKIHKKYHLRMYIVEYKHKLKEIEKLKNLKNINNVNNIINDKNKNRKLIDN